MKKLDTLFQWNSLFQ